MNEPCIKKCAPKRDTSEFLLKKDVTLDDLPPFSHQDWQRTMNYHEKLTITGVYLEKIVDRLQGREQTVWSRSTRPVNGAKTGRK